MSKIHGFEVDAPSRGLVAWRVATGALSLATAVLLLATSADHLVPTITAIAMAIAGVLSLNTVLGARLSTREEQLIRG